MLTKLSSWLSKKGAPQPVMAELSEANATLEALTGNSAKLALMHVVMETVLEHHGLLTQEVLDAVKPLIEAKLSKAQAPAPA